VIARSEWGAAHGTGSPIVGSVGLVVIHHFATPDVPITATAATEIAAMRSVERHHATVNKWAGIGYNFVVFRSGRAYEGRGWGRAGAHTAGHNSRSVGIACGWDGSKHPPSPMAATAIRGIIAQGLQAGRIRMPYEVAGHRDYAQTSCPGAHIYPLLDSLRPQEEQDPELGSEPERRPQVGDAKWSDFFGERLVLTRYVSDTDYDFVRVSTLRGLGTRGQSPWSALREP
jgi:peptidoglycan recognition protein